MQTAIQIAVEDTLVEAGSLDLPQYCFALPDHQTPAPQNPKWTPPRPARQPASHHGANAELKRQHELWARSLQSAVSDYLDHEVAIQLRSASLLTWQDFSSSLATPSHLTIFKIAGLPGICLAEVPPSLGMRLVSRLMGSTSGADSEACVLGDVEIALLDQVLEFLLGTWCKHWHRKDLDPEILAHESEAACARLAPAQTSVFVVSLRLEVGGLPGVIRLAFNQAASESLAPASRNPVPESFTAQIEGGPQWNPALAEVRMAVVAQWPQRQISARAVTNLSVGDVLEWHPGAAAEVQLRLSQKPRFVCRLGTLQGRWAVEITGQM